MCISLLKKRNIGERGERENTKCKVARQIYQAVLSLCNVSRLDTANNAIVPRIHHEKFTAEWEFLFVFDQPGRYFILVFCPNVLERNHPRERIRLNPARIRLTSEDEDVLAES